MSETSIIPSVIFVISIFAFFVGALGFKMLFDSKAEFKGGCASNNPMLRNEIGACTACGKVIDEDTDCDVTNDDSLPTIG